MPDKTPQETVSEYSNAGAPANPAIRQPTDEELDQLEREKARPRRPSGPPLADARGDDVSRTAGPPATTDPAAEISGVGEYPPTAQAAGSSETHAGDAGRPADFAPPKPSDDELDRRDRLKSGPRRVAGPPLREDDSSAALGVMDYEPPAPTEPQE
jgi:hypothetical protein